MTDVAEAMNDEANRAQHSLRCRSDQEAARLLLDAATLAEIGA